MRSPFPVKGSILCAMALSLIGLTGCHSDRVSVNPKDPQSPQYAYRLDELALLHMAADDVQDMERKKQYGQIYDEYGSDDFKKNVSRRLFLIMANCVENDLGSLDEFDTNDLGFRRESVKGNPKLTLDVLNRKVLRIQGPIEEQLVFVPNGLSFKLNGLYWIAKDKTFLQCIAESPQVEASTQPVPPAGAGTTQTAGAPAAEQTAAQPQTGEQAVGEPGKTSETAQPSAQEAATRTSEQGAPTPGAAASPPTPVQDMKPAEIKKAPLQARPAGAGAVIDERPVPKKSKAARTETNPDEDAAPDKSNAPAAGGPPVPVPSNPEPAMPLPVPPDEPGNAHH